GALCPGRSGRAWSRTETSLALSAKRTGGSVFVRLDNFLDQPVADDVAPGQPNVRDPLDPGQPVDGIDEAAGHVGRQVGLSRVSRHDDARTVPETGQKHLHLRDGRVLALVED